MGIIFSNGATISLPTPDTITISGLVMNLQTAPSVGTTWADSSGNGYSASLITAGAGTFAYTGSYGGGIVAGGTNGSTTAICTSYNLTSSFSVEMVVQPNAGQYWSVLWGNEVYSSRGWYAYWSNASSLIAGGPTSTLTYSSPTATSNVPVHLVFTLASGVFRMYRNGVLQTGTGTYSAPSAGVSTTGLNFGSRHPNSTGLANTPTDSLKGVYYQMRVYNRDLSQSEVTQNYNIMKVTYPI